jgi:hypothetical protein
MANAKKCSGNGVQTCALSGGCLKWGNAVACDTGKTCSNGACSPTCVPKTCNSLIYNCGLASDGCNGTLNCGTCAVGQPCMNNKCVTNVRQCVNNTCASGLACKDGNNCCRPDQCGYDVFPNGQCVDSGGTRSQGPLATNFNLVCRNGVFKTMANAWGCNYFGCDSGTCVNNVCQKTISLNSGTMVADSGLGSLLANISNTNAKINLDKILAKINEIGGLIARLQEQLKTIGSDKP